LVVSIKDRFTETLVPIPAQQIDLRVSRGYEEIGVSLDADATRTRFVGTAPFLAGVMAFSARAALPVNGAMTMGYFDPWVTPAVRPVPPNRVARFQCPMHDGIISESLGVCPLCGMDLAPIRRGPPATLHAADYDMRLETSPAPAAGTPLLLRFIPLREGRPLHGLTVVHEHPLHLIVLSADFTFFDHVHPAREPDDSLALPYAFPRPGRYLLYADITPAGERSQVFKLPVAVGNEAGDPDPDLTTSGPDLRPSPSLSKPVDGDPSITAELRFQPRTPVAGIEAHFLVRFSREGRPVNDLEPYLGAMAHGVFVSQDSAIFLHCHPEQLMNPAQTARSGPDIPFATFFPRPGLYKLWVQFKRQGTMGLVSYVVEVKSPVLPARVIRFLVDD
jgi:hypothetical protein